MGRKKSQRGSGADADSGWEDGSSMSSYTTAGHDYDESAETIDLFHQSLEHLFEKRRETREKALVSLIGFLRDDVRVEDCMQNEATIIGRCVQGLRRGGNLEAALSAQLFGLHLITLAEPQESHLREAQFDLQRAAASGSATEVRVAAIDALALACFVSAEDDVCCLEIMDRLQALWSSGDARAMAAAVRGWCLVVTRLNSPLSNERLESALGELARLLQANDVEVRGAAGEALALLYHTSRGGHGTLQRLAEQEEYGAGAEEYEEGGEDMVDTESAQEVVGRMRQLAVAHHKADRMQRSRKDRAAMKATFRGVLAKVESGTVQPIKVKLQHGDTLVVDTLEGTVQLAAVRKFLAGGFQVHLQRNSLLHALFDFTPRAEPASRLTALEKRATRSPCSAEAKWRTHERKGDRAFKSSRHTAPIMEDDA